MSIITRLQSRSGTTRGELTVTLLIALTAMAGFIWTSFFESRTTLSQRHDILGLIHHYDSVTSARKRQQLGKLDSTIAGTDTIRDWAPLADSDAVADSVAESRPAPSSKKVPPSGPVNINTASKASLMQLPGVGEKTAEAIIDLRTHIPFRHPEDLLNVKGIGDKKFEKIRPFIVVK